MCFEPTPHHLTHCVPPSCASHTETHSYSETHLTTPRGSHAQPVVSPCLDMSEAAVARSHPHSFPRLLARQTMTRIACGSTQVSVHVRHGRRHTQSRCIATRQVTSTSQRQPEVQHGEKSRIPILSRAAKMKCQLGHEAHLKMRRDHPHVECAEPL